MDGPSTAAAARRRGFTPCEHPAKVRTLVGDRALCRKCTRPYFPPPWFCEQCGNSKENQAHLPTHQRVRFRHHNGHQLCDPCAKERR